MSDQNPDLERLRSIKTLPQLVAYLRDELEWPIESDDIEDVTFEYEPEELGFDAASAVRFKEIKQIRPLEANQPWGIFWINFEKKRLPVVMLRRILANLAIKKRPSARRGDRPAWHPHDLLFISAYGEEHDRAITLAHFWQDPQTTGDLPVLKVLGWDDGDTVLHLADAHHALVEKLRWPDDPADVKLWRERWASAFTLGHKEVITTTQELVEELAKLAVAIRKRANSILARESKRGPMRRLHAAFQTALIHDLTEDDFADVIAQTISYGLLAARFSHPGGISVQHLVDMIPPTNPFLRELLEMFLNVAGRKEAFDFDELGIQDVVELLNQANAQAVKADFGNRTKNEDPIVHFYEHFLKAYDPKKKVQRGVFYTPQSVVSYIVRSVHELLQTEFGIEDGLASTVTWGEMRKRITDLIIPDGAKPDDFFVVVLDPATGTATFLVEIIEIIFTYLKNKWGKEGAASMPPVPGQGRASTFNDYWNVYVPHALLPRLYGYELMMAPYTIAHMKLGLKLVEINARLGQPDYKMELESRAHIYLTNSLEPASDIGQQDLVGIFPALAHEAQAVNAVKRKKRFSVVIGNPPYAGWSANLTPETRAIVERYKTMDGERIHEKGALQFEKNIQDDYVKFFAWSEKTATAGGTGILSFISNNGFLETPTLRGMRWHLLRSFSKLWLLDLHGSTKRPIKADQNVFDIQQGVAISVLTKLPPTSQMEPAVYRGDLVGSRAHKYTYLCAESLVTTPWKRILPLGPLYQFAPLDSNLHREYSLWPSLPEIMPIFSTGTETGFDSLMVDFTKEELRVKIRRFIDPQRTDADIKVEFSVGEGTSRKLLDMRREFREDFNANGGRRCIRGMYRVFDSRFYYYKKEWLKTNSFKVMRNLLEAKNVALVAFRQQSQDGFQHVFVTKELGDKNAVSLRTREINYYFPLRILPETEGLSIETGQLLNFSNSFLKRLAEELGNVITNTNGVPVCLTSEDMLLHYIYAVFHSPNYRGRYAQFLKNDFPRLPLTSSLELFRSLAKLGNKLIALHLMESPKLEKHITKWLGTTPSREVEKVAYSDQTVWIDKAKTEGFGGVYEDVWNFHIGGYQVCEKWLKDRKGRRLSAEDIEHYHRIVIVLNETIRIMGEIDQVVEDHGGWPGAFS